MSSHGQMRWRPLCTVRSRHGHTEKPEKDGGELGDPGMVPLGTKTQKEASEEEKKQELAR